MKKCDPVVALLVALQGKYYKIIVETLYGKMAIVYRLMNNIYKIIFSFDV